MAQMENAPAVEEIRAFATDLYNYIWTKHQFRNESLEVEFAARLSLKFSDLEETSSSPFNDDIGKAVLCSQYLLREQSMDLFRHFKGFLTFSKESFIYIINLIYYLWSEVRSDFFFRLIDICAILAEAILFCDSQSKPFIKLQEVPDIFVGIFETHFSERFFQKGGWRQLQAQVREYSPILPFLTFYINRCNVPYVILFYDCDLIQFLRESSVGFPVQLSWFCQNCKIESDRQYYEILNPECTIEELVTRYSLQDVPWEKDTNQNPIQEDETSASSASLKPILFERFYVLLGKGKKNVGSLEQKQKKRTPKKKRNRKKSAKTESECSASK